MIGVIFLFALSLIVSSGLVSFALKETRASRLLFSSLTAYASAESGVEDVTFRIMNAMTVDTVETLAVNGTTATTTSQTVGGNREVTSESIFKRATRRVQTVLIADAVGAAFTYGAQVGYLGLVMGNNSEVRGSVYSNGSITGGSGATITGDAWVAAGTATTTDQGQETQTDNLTIRDAASRRDAAQGFSPSITANIAKISLYIKKNGSPANADVFIVPNNGGVPDNGNEAANGTLNASLVTGSYAWVDVAMDPNDPLIAGQTYWIVIDNSTNNASTYYTLGGASNTSYAAGTFKYSADWDAGSPTWTAPGAGARDGAFRIYMGENNTEIADVTVEGDAHAHTIENTNITGDAYYQSIAGSTVGGTSYPDSADPPTENLPFSDGQIAEFKSWGDDGGTCGQPMCDASGNYTLDDDAGALGPIYIPGNMTVANGARLTVNGTIHVGGNILFNNNCLITLDDSYDDTSGFIVADGTIRVDNRCSIAGSGDPTSYLMIITTSEQLENPAALEIRQNASGTIFYAAKGTALLNNNGEIKEVIGHKLQLDPTSILEYEIGLANVQFSAGPTGGYSIYRWNEVE